VGVDGTHTVYGCVPVPIPDLDVEGNQGVGQEPHVGQVMDGCKYPSSGGQRHDARGQEKEEKVFFERPVFHWGGFIAQFQRKSTGRFFSGALYGVVSGLFTSGF
jgi:hypothetical protein